jgi:hypothetical protein
MSKPLSSQFLLEEKLTPQERMYLKSMSFHEGFPVLQKLFNEACAIAHADVVKADPESPDYDRILAVRYQRERNINEFCEAIRKSFNAHVGVITKEIEKEATREEKARTNAGNNSN